MFFAALATIALLALPYAAGDVPVALDRSLSFVILDDRRLARARDPRRRPRLTLGALGLPDRAAGLWLAALGLALLSRAVYDISREPRF